MPSFEMPQPLATRRASPERAPVKDWDDKRAKRSAVEGRWLDGLGAPKQEAGEKLLAAFQTFADQFGKPGVEELAKTLNRQGTIRMEDITRVQREIPPREEFRAAMIKRLEELKILRREKGFMVADVDAFRGGIQSKLVRSKGAGFEGGRFDAYFEHGLPDALYASLKDLQVISEDDWNKGRETPPPSLFFIPPKRRMRRLIQKRFGKVIFM